MATISLAQLKIDPVANNQARVTVNTRIRFSHLELAQMAQGLKFRLDCRLFGQDIPPNADDALIFVGPSKIYPDATPNPIENHTFSATVPRAFLNEDVGVDELYARVFLRNLATGLTVNKKSNVEVEIFLP